ncbi:MAG: ATP-dependent DNA ligase [Methanomicrobiales archaeon]|nr:ATP-dependent DNA ligase [Methanomicrobiales archaeon]
MGSGGDLPSFVVHEHHARTHHFDLRLEHGSVLASWAVPKGVPEKAGAKHLAIRTEDHAMEYRDFEGTIPEGEYGAGEVTVWDHGTFEPLKWEEDRIEVVLHGGRLQGRYVLVPFRRAGAGQWLVLKAKEG